MKVHLYILLFIWGCITFPLLPILLPLWLFKADPFWMDIFGHLVEKIGFFKEEKYNI